MLKPEYHLSPVPHEITDMIKFSDGEKLTAAILLYCVLVRTSGAGTGEGR